MKRIIIAFAILLAVASLCVITLMIQTKSIKELLSTVDRIQQAYDESNFEKCLALSCQFTDQFESETDIFPFFMRHSDVSKIEETAVSLPVLLEAGDTQHFAAELAKCRHMLENMAELETPAPENIM